MVSNRGRLVFALVMTVVACRETSSTSAEEIPAADSRGLEKAIRSARPGDTIVMADGDWRDAAIVFEARGEPGRPITLRAATPGKAVLVGKSRLEIAGHDLVVTGLIFTRGAIESGSVVGFRRDDANEATRCRLTDCAIVDYNPPGKDPDTKWVSIYGESNRVDHCYFAGKTNQGQTLVVWVGDRPNRHVIDFNHFGPRPPLGRNGGETLRVGTSNVSMNVSRTVVEKNLFERCDGEVEAVSNKSCENVYRHNTFLNCSATLTLRHGNRCLVDGNDFLGNHVRGSGGVRVIGEGHRVVNNYFEGLEGDGARAAVSLANGIPGSPLNGYFQVKEALVAFNTMVDNRSTFAIGVGNGRRNTLPPQDCRIANNLVVTRHAPIVRIEASPIRLTWEGNLFSADPGISMTTGNVVADPRLAKGDDGLLRPGPGSPALGAAVGDFSFLREDHDGQPRAGAFDVGCDQRSDRPVLHRPLTPRDVGPSWRREGPPGSGR